MLDSVDRPRMILEEKQRHPWSPTAARGRTSASVSPSTASGRDDRVPVNRADREHLPAPGQAVAEFCRQREVDQWTGRSRVARPGGDGRHSTRRHCAADPGNRARTQVWDPVRPTTPRFDRAVRDRSEPLPATDPSIGTHPMTNWSGWWRDGASDGEGEVGHQLLPQGTVTGERDTVRRLDAGVGAAPGETQEAHGR